MPCSGPPHPRDPGRAPRAAGRPIHALFVGALALLLVGVTAISSVVGATTAWALDFCGPRGTCGTVLAVRRLWLVGPRVITSAAVVLACVSWSGRRRPATWLGVGLAAQLVLTLVSSALMETV
jgi:hypothetical protein